MKTTIVHCSSNVLVATVTVALLALLHYLVEIGDAIVSTVIFSPLAEQ